MARKKTRSRPVPASSLLAQQIMAIREAEGVTREDLAKRSGIEYLRLWRLETGKTRPLAEDIARIADALRRPVGDFYEARAS